MATWTEACGQASPPALESVRPSPRTFTQLLARSLSPAPVAGHHVAYILSESPVPSLC